MAKNQVVIILTEEEAIRLRSLLLLFQKHVKIDLYKYQEQLIVNVVNQISE